MLAGRFLCHQNLRAIWLLIQVNKHKNNIKFLLYFSLIIFVDIFESLMTKWWKIKYCVNIIWRLHQSTTTSSKILFDNFLKRRNEVWKFYFTHSTSKIYLNAQSATTICTRNNNIYFFMYVDNPLTILFNNIRFLWIRRRRRRKIVPINNMFHPS